MSLVRPVTKPFERPIRLGVLISGGGTTLRNFADRIADRSLDAEVAAVIASCGNCGGIKRAAEVGLPVTVVERGEYKDVESFSQCVFERLREARVDLVTLAGFLSLLRIPPEFRYRVMNIHPALIPAFCGKGMYGHKVHETVLARGAKVSGCSVHFADEVYDHGPIIVQRSVPVLDDDTADTLAARVFQAECEAYPEAIRMYASGRLEIDGATVRLAKRA